MDILIINGPNLNLLGTREPHIYGSRSFDDFLAELRTVFTGHAIEAYQSNVEGALIDKLQEADRRCHGVVFNGAGFTHTSVALRDALAAVAKPFIEVHLSNVHAREAFRRHSYFSDQAVGVICGLGSKGYDYALAHALGTPAGK